MIVVDTSVALQWVLPEDDSVASQDLAGRDDVIGPDVLLVEAANVLGKNLRAGSLSLEQAIGGLELIRENVRLEPTVPLLARALELSARIAHPVYDCVFLACALASETVVVTRDARFVDRAASGGYGANVKLFPFGAGTP